MDTDTFMECLKSLSAYIETQNIEKPIILFVDGHSSHSTYDAAMYCSQNGTVLYCLLPHASHLTQPLDVGVFSQMQKKWKEAVVQFQMANPNAIPTKYIFPQLFRSVWFDINNKANLVAGFEAAGIFPLNSNILVDRLVSEKNPAISQQSTSHLPVLPVNRTPVPANQPNVPGNTPTVVPANQHIVPDNTLPVGACQPTYCAR